MENLSSYLKVSAIRILRKEKRISIRRKSTS